jgi:ribosome biogenesis GTPase A
MNKDDLKIQWYPGHMTKTKRMLKEQLRLVDAVVEMLDARIPRSSRNPDIDGLAAGKRRLLVLNKADLADADITAAWKRHYEKMGFAVVATDCAEGKGINKVTAACQTLTSDKAERLMAKGRVSPTVRIIILGIPNCGKSTLINRLAKRGAAKTADRPGVTRDRQWIRVDDRLELLDTPGVLWPKFDDAEIGINLAITGAINDKILDAQTLARRLLTILTEIKPNAVIDRYKLTDGYDDTDSMLEAIGKSRGFLQKGGSVDTERAAVIHDYQNKNAVTKDNLYYL